MQLRAFFDKRPELGDICSFDELRQSYQGTVDDRTLVYNFASLNFSESLKRDMVEFIASQYQREVVKYPALQRMKAAAFAQRFETHYLIYLDPQTVDRLTSLGVLIVFQKLQSDDPFYKKQAFEQLDPSKVLRRATKPASTTNYCRSGSLSLSLSKSHTPTPDPLARSRKRVATPMVQSQLRESHVQPAQSSFASLTS